MENITYSTQSEIYKFLEYIVNPNYYINREYEHFFRSSCSTDTASGNDDCGDICSSRNFCGSEGGIKYFCDNPVYTINHVKTIIEYVNGNIAKGRILNDDLTTTPCYIAKCDVYFAHGKTAKEAIYAAYDQFLENLLYNKKV